MVELRLPAGWQHLSEVYLQKITIDLQRFLLDYLLGFRIGLSFTPAEYTFMNSTVVSRLLKVYGQQRLTFLVLLGGKYRLSLTYRDSDSDSLLFGS